MRDLFLVRADATPSDTDRQGGEKPGMAARPVAWRPHPAL